MGHPLLLESIWFDKHRVEDAERVYQEKLASQHAGLVVEKNKGKGLTPYQGKKRCFGSFRCSHCNHRWMSAQSFANASQQCRVCDVEVYPMRQGSPSSLVSEIARVRKNIQNTLSTSGGTGLAVGLAVENNLVGELKSRLSAVEKENQDLRQVTQDLQSAVSKLQQKVAALEKSGTTASAAAAQAPSAAPSKKVEEDDDEDSDDDDDDIDLFGSDAEEEEAAAKLKEQRLKEYAEKKAKKGPGPVAKSNIILDVKPLDDETDMGDLESKVRSIEADGLLWGASKLIPVVYGIKKLQISCVVEDDKIGTDFLEEEIEKFEDLIQSMDVVAFNKV